MSVHAGQATGKDGDAWDAAGASWALWRRQILGVAGMELRKSLRGRMAWVAFGLALLPVALMLIKAMVFIVFGQEIEFTGLGNEEIIYADMFETLVVRLVIFFGCVALFVRLIRGDMLAGTLHHYLLQPVRREVLIVGKYLGALAAAVLVFGGATAIARLAMYLPYGASETLAHLGGASGLPHLLGYVGIAALACAGYGAVFLVVGLLMRNPIVPVLVILAWETANLFLPAMLKPFSIIWYLQGLIPVPIDRGRIAIVVEPAPAVIAVPGLLLVATLLVGLAAWRARSLEIAYGDD